MVMHTSSPGSRTVGANACDDVDASLALRTLRHLGPWGRPMNSQRGCVPHRLLRLLRRTVGKGRAVRSRSFPHRSGAERRARFSGAARLRRVEEREVGMIGEQREVAFVGVFGDIGRAHDVGSGGRSRRAWAASAMAQALAAVLVVSVISVSLESIRLRRIGRERQFRLRVSQLPGACRRRAW